jgi:hypothetical protein
MLEVFEVQFKNSIRYGMTYNQFWFDDPQLYYIYEESYREQLEDRLKEKDIFNWQLGQYIQLAIGSCLDKNIKYPNSPIFNKEQATKPKTTLDMLEKFKTMVDQVNKNF